MSATKLLILACLAFTYISLSEGLDCWFCLREDTDFEKPLAGTCRNMTCPEGAVCYIEVLEGNSQLCFDTFELCLISMNSQ